MNVLGIIMECNPLHNGHAYFIQKAKEMCNADFCIAVMSGDYVQRGFPAFFSKELRTKALLKNGADLVLELPVSFSTGSAEYFARAGVSLLAKLGCVDFLCFGSECGDISLFREAARLLIQTDKSSTYSDLLTQKLKEGKSFPTARFEALSSMKEYGKYLPLLESPNNILGLEYCLALELCGSKIEPFTFKREGDGYHDSASEETTFASASGIRKVFRNSSDDKYMKYLPENCQELYADALAGNHYVNADDFSLLLSRQVLFSDVSKLASYQDVTMDFAEKLTSRCTECTSFTSYCDAMKSKNYTYTRISRSLLHIVLEITKESVAKQVDADYALYARILGFRKESQTLLSYIKKSASIPLISKLADAKALLNALQYEQLHQTITASHLYNAVLSQKSGQEMKHEYSKKIIIV